MSLGELLDASFTIFRRHFATLVVIAAICYGPFQVMNVYIETAGGWGENVVLLLLALLVASLGALVGSAANLKVISDGYLGRETTPGEAMRFALGRIGPLMLAGFAKYLLVFLAFLLFVIPGVIVACGYAVVSQVVVLEQPENATDALGRSWSLTKGHKGTALALGFILGLVASLPGFVAGIMAAVGLGITAQIVGGIAAIALAPLVPCGMTLYYYDLRVRKEAFDLQALDLQLGGATA